MSVGNVPRTKAAAAKQAGDSVTIHLQERIDDR
jgi:hypothetical protein